MKIKLDIRGAWKPTLINPLDVFIMEAFIDKGYPISVLKVLNDVRVYMQVMVLSDISNNGIKMSQWAIEARKNPNSQWSWPPRRVPTSQNLKVWRDCLRGTFMNGVDDLLEPICNTPGNYSGHSAYPLFNFSTMTRGSTLMDTIRQYPPELLSIIGDLYFGLRRQ